LNKSVVEKVVVECGAMEKTLFYVSLQAMDTSRKVFVEVNWQMEEN